MFIRERKFNWSLERAVYKPAVEDTGGAIITHPVRTTEYLGSIKSYSRFAHVSGELLEKLSDEEKSQLRDALKGNEPQHDLWLGQLDYAIRHAAAEIKACVDMSSGENVAKRKLLEAKMKAIDDAWNHFFKSAQDHGLKRKSRRAVKALPPADAEPTYPLP